jgi:MFS family permease
MTGGLLAGMTGGLLAGMTGGLTFGLAFGLVTGLAGRFIASLNGMRGGAGLPDWLAAGLFYGLFGGLIVGLIVGLAALLSAGASRVVAEPPRRLAGKGLGAVLTATRNAGFVGGLIAAVIAGLAVEVAGGQTRGGHSFAAVTGLAVWLVFGLVLGMDAWFFHHWLRHRLARKGCLPQRLRSFVEWCALPERGWLRISDACEFRHRELLDHLALDSEPDSGADGRA